MFGKVILGGENLGPVKTNYLDSIGATEMSLSVEVAETFRHDVENPART